MRIAVAVATIVGMVITVSLQAQAPFVPQTIRATPSCTSCRIELVKVVTLGSASDSVLLDDRAQPVRDARGRYYAWGTDPGRIAVYDSGGRFIRAIGRRGQGPGEFRGSGGAIVPGPGDSLRVFQPPRIRLFDPEYRYVRGIDLPSGVHGSALPLADGRVVYPFMRIRAHEGSPLHILSSEGAIVRSFGIAAPLAVAGCSGCSVRQLAASRSPDRFWAARANTYQVEQWSTSGELLRVFVVERSEWFPARIAAKLTSGELRPNRTTPYLAGIWEDSNSMLWIVGSASRSGEIDETNPPRRGISIVPRDSATLARYPRRTIVEVIDPASRTVVASRSMNETYGEMGDGLVYSRRQDADGFMYVDIWRVVLRRP